MVKANRGIYGTSFSAVRFIAASPVLAGISLAAIAYLLWWVLERWAALLGAASPQPARDGMFVVLLSVQMGYFVSVVPLLRRAGRQCIEQLRPLLHSSEPTQDDLIVRFSTTRPLVLPLAAVAGAILAVGLQEAQFSRFSAWLGDPDAALGEMFTVLMAWTTWSIGLSAVVVVISDVSAMRRLGLSYVTIDLLRIEQLAAFSRYGLHLAGAVVGLMVLWSVILVLITSLIGSTMTERTGYVGIVMVVTYICLSITVFIYPQLGIRERVRSEKARLNEQLTSLLPTSHQTVEWARVDPQRLAALLSTKADIQSVSEWPTGELTRLRLAFYLLVPLLSWSAAALVEELVSRLLS
ncbi:MAG: hypothetical protein KDI33_10875 [Halioglobus sp.]|nr:hypothetical protein [Halioglobus sp.]